MKVNGRLITCDRCGATAFAKTTGDGEADGGFTRWNKFEELDGWGCKCISLKENMIGDTYDLCPNCMSEYINIQREYLNANKDFIGSEGE